MTRLIEIGISGVFILVTTYVVVEIGRPFWRWITEWLGTELVPIFALLVVLALFAAIFSILTGIGLPYFLIGGGVVYIAWLMYLESTAGPFDSPVHIIMGILFLVSFGFGAGLAESADQYDLIDRRTVY